MRTEASTQLEPSGIPVPKTRHETIDEAEWQRIRQPFEQLYKDHDLKEVMKIMQEQYGFCATMTMFKKRVGAWGLSKNLSSDDISLYGNLAVKLITESRPLPQTDTKGRIIPWNRVRRHFGRHKIPLRYLPARFRKTQRANLKPRQPCQAPAKINHVQYRTYIFEETLVFYIGEWYAWCRTMNRPDHDPRLNTLSEHLRAMFENWRKDGRCQMIDDLSTLAMLMQTSINGSSTRLLSNVLQVWSRLQHPVFEQHGVLFSRFLFRCCMDSVGEANPLCHLTKTLHETAVSRKKLTFSQAMEMDLTVAAEALLNGYSQSIQAQGHRSDVMTKTWLFIFDIDDISAWNRGAVDEDGRKIITRSHMQRDRLVRRYRHEISTINPSDYDDTVAAVLLALIYTDNGQYQDAIESWQSILRRSRALSDTFRFRVYRALTDLYEYLEDYAKLEQYVEAQFNLLLRMRSPHQEITEWFDKLMDTFLHNHNRSRRDYFAGLYPGLFDEWISRRTTCDHDSADSWLSDTDGSVVEDSEMDEVDEEDT